MAWILDQTGKEIQQVPNTEDQLVCLKVDTYQTHTGSTNQQARSVKFGRNFTDWEIHLSHHPSPTCTTAYVIGMKNTFNLLQVSMDLTLTYCCTSLAASELHILFEEMLKFSKKKKLLWKIKIGLDKESCLEYLTSSSTDCVLKLTMYCTGPISSMA